VRFEWDPDKAAHNRKKHGVSFEEAQTVFEDDHFVVFEDPAIRSMRSATSSWDNPTRGAFSLSPTLSGAGGFA
jgi:uncharacterized DUF497 family protein